MSFKRGVCRGVCTVFVAPNPGYLTSLSGVSHRSHRYRRDRLQSQDLFDLPASSLRTKSTLTIITFTVDPRQDWLAI